MWLKRDLVSDTLAELEVVYLSGARCRAWNQQRNAKQPVMFAGWYWLNGKYDAGPFKSKSAAIRDGWYRMIIIDQPPGLRSVKRHERKNSE